MADDANIETDSMTVLDEIAAERRRQIEKEGWSAAHDDSHSSGDLARAAAVYAITSTMTKNEIDRQKSDLYGLSKMMFSVINNLWPWEARWFKPQGNRRDLVRAAALIVAEIDRLDRKERVAAQFTWSK